MTNTEQLAQTLKDDGWDLSYVFKDEEGDDGECVFDVTIKHNGRTFTTGYTKGAAHRIWKKKIPYYTKDSCWTKYYKPGEKINIFFKINPDTIKEFKALTEPIPPTIEDVLYCLLADASCVQYGQTFEEFCSELGYDTDSRKAEKIFNVCRDVWAALIRLGADFEKLNKLFQDY